MCTYRLSTRCRNGRFICMVICRGMLMSRAISQSWAMRYVSTLYPHFCDFVWSNAKPTVDLHVMVWHVGSCDGDSSRSRCGPGYGGTFLSIFWFHFFANATFCSAGRLPPLPHPYSSTHNPLHAPHRTQNLRTHKTSVCEWNRQYGEETG